MDISERAAANSNGTSVSLLTVAIVVSRRFGIRQRFPHWKVISTGNSTKKRDSLASLRKRSRLAFRSLKGNRNQAVR